MTRPMNLQAHFEQRASGTLDSASPRPEILTARHTASRISAKCNREGPHGQEVEMLQRGRLSEFRRRADVRLGVRRMYPVQKPAARAAEAVRFARQRRCASRGNPKPSRAG